MPPAFALRLCFDAVAAALLLFGLSYWWLGNRAHEAAGTALFLLLVLHNGSNRRWYGRTARDPDARRGGRALFNVATIALLATAMTALLVTSVLISENLGGLLPLGGSSAARQAHVLAAYWALVAVSLHLGLRWPMIMALTGNLLGLGKPGVVRAALLRLAAAAIALHGLWSSSVLGMGGRLRMEPSLDWWSFETSVSGFFVHGAAIAGLYMAAAYYGTKWAAAWLPRAAGGLGPTTARAAGPEAKRRR